MHRQARLLLTDGSFCAHLDSLQVVLWEGVTGCWTGEEKGVMCVTGWVLLGLKQAVEVPEGALHVVVGGHLSETHVGEDLAVLAAHLQDKHMHMVGALPASDMVEVPRVHVWYSLCG